MDAFNPPALTLHDLDRDELLGLLSGHRFPVRELWSARYEVLAGRSAAADAASCAACQRWDEASAAVDAIIGSGGKRGGLQRALKSRQEAWDAYLKAQARALRASRAADRAWKGLSSCFDGAR